MNGASDWLQCHVTDEHRRGAPRVAAALEQSGYQIRGNTFFLFTRTNNTFKKVMSPEFLTYSDLTKKKSSGVEIHFNDYPLHNTIWVPTQLHFHPNSIENDYGSNVTILSICNEQRDKSL